MIKRDPWTIGMAILGVLAIVLVSVAIPVTLYLAGY
jgi:hypothetical protein